MAIDGRRIGKCVCKADWVAMTDVLPAIKVTPHTNSAARTDSPKGNTIGRRYTTMAIADSRTKTRSAATATLM